MDQYYLFGVGCTATLGILEGERVLNISQFMGHFEGNHSLEVGKLASYSIGEINRKYTYGQPFGIYLKCPFGYSELMADFFPVSVLS